MTTALVANKNSTIVRFWATPLQWTLRAYFGIVSRLLPDLAQRHAERLFTSPPQCGGRRTQPADARRDTVVAARHALPVWQEGPAAAPGILLVHGWGGCGAQMGAFVAPLLAQGYRAVWFDQPGHGESGRGSVGLPDFVRAVEAIVGTHGPFAAGIGHSLGAAALGLALRRGLRLGRVVFVSPPASIDQHARNFARLFGFTPNVREAMRRRLERRYGARFADIDRIEKLEQVRVSALFVHDSGDADVPFEHSLRLSARMHGARLLRTYGLGHYRVLRDRAVVATIVSFVGGRADALPAELPALPRPAPIY